MSEKFKGKYRIPSARLPYWDYGRNAGYFITICTQNRIRYFGAIENGELVLPEIGRLARTYWQEIPNHFPFVLLDESVVMPNHVHGIIIIDKPDENDKETRHCLVSTPILPAQKRFRNPGKNNISSIIGSYKSVVSKHAHKIHTEFAWQARFYDHVIRNKNEFLRIQQYIPLQSGKMGG